jgi:hypothetical protein
VQDVLSSWLEQGTDLLGLVESLADLYRQGYGELAVALHAAGWRDHGSGMLNQVVDALHQLRPPAASIDATRLAVAALHQAVATEPLYGDAFRRSAGLSGAAASDPTAQLRWWTRQLQLALGLEPSPRAVRSPRNTSNST